MKFSMHTPIAEIPLGLLAILAVILFTQAVWLFMDASKQNANKWLWGIWGLIQFPTPLILYLLIVRKILSRGKKEKRIRNLLIAFLILITIILVTLGIIFHE